MWVGTKLEQETKKQSLIDEKILNAQVQIIQHFDDSLESCSWFDKVFVGEILINFGPLTARKYGYCETCIHYVGIPKIKRKLFGIKVINSYCKNRINKVLPEQRCSLWNPMNFWKKVILSDIKSMIRKKRWFSLLKLFHRDSDESEY